MVAFKVLSTAKTRVSGERVTRKSGRDQVAAETKKSIPVKDEISHNNVNSQKEALNKLDKINGKNISTARTAVGRKALGDISNSQGVLKRNAAVDGSKPGKGKVERMTYTQRASVSSGKDLKVFNGNPKTRGQETGKGKMEGMTYTQRVSVSSGKDLKVSNSNLKTKGQESGKGKMETVAYSQRASVSSVKDLKVFNDKSKTKDQQTVGYVTRKSVKTYCPPRPLQRKSLPVFKHVDKEEKSDIKKGEKDNKLKNKERHGFFVSVKPKVGTTIAPQVSNTRENRRKNRVSDGCIRM
ncbi:uncharacterized protein LOC143629136 isoform X2 [Bidens hawaiensis]|uniref:uncharacterized protein LOC143629136 isoform X2 n=1 Tax=Bidens hawaiensis TaxID=980011 RepID=UPI004048FCCC